MKNATIRALFVGNFLSKHRGTKGISEKLINLLSDSSKIDLILTSDIKNPILRGLHIFICVLFKKYDIGHIDVYSGNSFYYALMASALFRLRKKKYICTLRGGRLPEFYSGFNKPPLSLFNNATYINTPSQYLRFFFLDRGIKVNYLPNYIDLNVFSYSRENVDPYSILWVRAFTEIYNPKIPVECLKLVKTKYPLAKLTMVGPDLGLMDDIKEYASSLGILKSINFTGPVVNEKLPKIYQSHAVYLNTSSFESFGAAVLEAASCGIPIVSSSVGEIPLLWKNNKEILLVEKITAVDYVNKVINIFENAELSTKLSNNAASKSMHYDWKKIIEAWIKLLKDTYSCT